MDITPYVESLRHDLVAAADAGGAEARAAAERLALAIDPATRLALMDALSQAAAEITSELPAGTIEVRLKGREPQFVVDVPGLHQPEPTVPIAAAGESAPADEPEEDGNVARITLRIPEAVKSRAEEMASKSGQSLNTWLVNAIRSATRERAINVDIDLSSVPFLEGFGPGRPRGPRRGSGRRMTGWVGSSSPPPQPPDPPAPPFPG